MSQDDYVASDRHIEQAGGDLIDDLTEAAFIAETLTDEEVDRLHAMVELRIRQAITHRERFGIEQLATPALKRDPDDIHAFIESPAAPPAPEAAPPQPDSAEWWRDVAQKLGVQLHDARLAHECSEAVLSMAVSRLGGLVEGQPTHRINFLQRIDALVAAESAALASSSPTPDLAEICICAAIRFSDGRIVRGHRHDACFRTAEGWTPKPDLKEHVQGFITSRNRFVDRREGWRLMAATNRHSAHTGLAFAGTADGTLFSEDLYFDAHDHAALALSAAPRPDLVEAESLVISSVEPAYVVHGSPLAIGYLRSVLRMHHDLMERVALGETVGKPNENGTPPPSGDSAETAASRP